MAPDSVRSPKLFDEVRSNLILIQLDGVKLFDSVASSHYVRCFLVLHVDISQMNVLHILDVWNRASKSLKL